MWRGTSVDPDGRTTGWGLLAIPEPAQQDVTTLAHLIATASTHPGPRTPQRCLIRTGGTTTGPRWGNTPVDTVRVGFPVLIRDMNE